MVPFAGTHAKQNFRSRERSPLLPTLIERATRIQAAGNMPKIIDEYVGRVNLKENRISVAHMRSPAGWTEPGQTIITHPGEWVQYSTPDEPTEYIAICIPAFSLETVHRDETA